MCRYIPTVECALDGFDMIYASWKHDIVVTVVPAKHMQIDSLAAEWSMMIQFGKWSKGGKHPEFRSFGGTEGKI